MNQLLQVSLRQNAIYIPANTMVDTPLGFQSATGVLVANLAKLGFGVSEQLLIALNKTLPGWQAKIGGTCEDVMGTKKNWTPLVKGWDQPTGETIADHINTWFVNVFGKKGAKMPCGHIIPSGTFPLNRYNGCPYCKTPFQVGKLELYQQSSAQRVLELWSEEELNTFLADLLTSKTALDATQMDSLKVLLENLPLPGVKIGMKETLMVVIASLVKCRRFEEAQTLFTSPADILRYLWYQQTGFYQLIEPATIITRKTRNTHSAWNWQRDRCKAKVAAFNELRLKYSRQDCVVVAGWLNNLPMSVEKMCETMHAKRGMWVRFIRALRLGEYSKRKGFDKLRALLDMFYKQQYAVLQGEIDRYRSRFEAAKVFERLQQRPGLFARSLFANMLWFGHDAAIEAFKSIRQQVPARLLFTLEMYAADYFDAAHTRSVKPLGGTSRRVPANQLLCLYDRQQLQTMQQAVRDLCLTAMEDRFAAIVNKNKTIYIDPELFHWPVSIGDRSETVQDSAATLMGTRFPLAGNTVRLFMQWGTGLPSQHLDMDLSCQVVYHGHKERCSFRDLAITGCKHSGDIIHIPHMKGTAEYIEIDTEVLKKAGACYVLFTCNAYSNGNITPNLVIGWMDSEYPMRVSKESGVAYDPSCVQHQVRVTRSLAKGLLFGVLDIWHHEIIWLEMPFQGQLVQNLEASNVEVFLRKLSNKLTVGELLLVKGMAQKLRVLETTDADEVYTKEWALNTAAVTKLLID